jgi:hypothetical protein
MEAHDQLAVGAVASPHLGHLLRTEGAQVDTVGNHVPRLVHTELFVAAGDSIPHHDVRAEVRAIQELHLLRTELGVVAVRDDGPRPVVDLLAVAGEQRPVAAPAGRAEHQRVTSRRGGAQSAELQASGDPAAGDDEVVAVEPRKPGQELGLAGVVVSPVPQFREEDPVGRGTRSKEQPPQREHVAHAWETTSSTPIRKDRVA